MSAGSLVEKLAKVGAVEKEGSEPCFTPQFAGYVIWICGTNALMEMTVGNWLDILRGFHPSLGSLTPDEIADVALLFDYYLSQPDIQTSAVK